VGEAWVFEENSAKVEGAATMVGSSSSFVIYIFPPMLKIDVVEVILLVDFSYTSGYDF